MEIANCSTQSYASIVLAQMSDTRKRIGRSIKLTLVLLLLGSCAVTYPRGWRGIVPLHSTREDVERLLGAPGGDCKCIYDLQHEIVQVTYSQGSCVVGGSGGWDIQPGTVIRFNIQPKTRQPLRRFVLNVGLDLRTFSKIEDPELPRIFYYKDARKGLIISVDGQTVLDYGFEPIVADKNLRCQAQTKSKKI